MNGNPQKELPDRPRTLALLSQDSTILGGRAWQETEQEFEFCRRQEVAALAAPLRIPNCFCHTADQPLRLQP